LVIKLTEPIDTTIDIRGQLQIQNPRVPHPVQPILDRLQVSFQSPTGAVGVHMDRDTRVDRPGERVDLRAELVCDAADHTLGQRYRNLDPAGGGVGRSYSRTLVR